jgi:hypothetical protein
VDYLVVHVGRGHRQAIAIVPNPSAPKRYFGWATKKDYVVRECRRVALAGRRGPRRFSSMRRDTDTVCRAHFGPRNAVGTDHLVQRGNSIVACRICRIR